MLFTWTFIVKDAELDLKENLDFSYVQSSKLFNIGADSYLRGNAPKDKRTVQGY